jgi:hypothetical protein
VCDYLYLLLTSYYLHVLGIVTFDTKDDIIQYYDVIEMEEPQNEDISEPYYSEIIQCHNDNSDSGYIMKSNVSYSTSQITNTTIDISGHGQSLASVCTTLKPSNSVEALGKTAQQKQPSDYEDIH